MQDTINLFKNYQLNNLQKENSTLNLKEFNEEETKLKSYPRRLFIKLYSPGNDENPNQYFNPALMNTIRPSLSFAEEIVLITSEQQEINKNLQNILHYIDDFKINKSLSVNINALKEVSPWIFQYNVSKVNVNIGNDIKSFITILETSSPIRELVVRKYFAIVKPYITITADIFNSNSSQLEKLVDVVSDIGADSLVLHASETSNTSANENIYEKVLDSDLSEVANRAEMYGLDISIPNQCLDNHTNLYFYPSWSDLYLLPGGFLRSFCLAEDKIMKLPALGSSFISDIWNSDAVIKTRYQKVNPGDISIPDRAAHNQELYIFRDSTDD